MNIPRGERYELCRSVHAEANAIINASRSEMIGGTLYLVGIETATGELVPGCQRLFHVQKTDHQRRHLPGGDPQQPG